MGYLTNLTNEPTRREWKMAKAARNKKPTTTKKSSARTIRHRPTEEEIRNRAYDIYLQRGSAQGNDLDDWLKAERELDLVNMK
jgi:Protein of unknown function (DUF2934)